MKKLLFDEKFTVPVFIVGFKYTRRRQYECQLKNFIVGKNVNIF